MSLQYTNILKPSLKQIFISFFLRDCFNWTIQANVKVSFKNLSSDEICFAFETLERVSSFNEPIDIYPLALKEWFPRLTQSSWWPQDFSIFFGRTGVNVRES